MSVFRAMTIDDYDAAYALWSSTAGMGLSEADSRANIGAFLERSIGMSFVCEEDGRLVGTSLCGHDGRRGHLYHVAVDRDYRGLGIGRRLVEACLTELKKAGIHKCHLMLIADNEVGAHFWQQTGWQRRDDILLCSRDVT